MDARASESNPPQRDSPQRSSFDAQLSTLPETAVRRWMRPVIEFMHVESTSGFLLLAATVIALILANSAWSHQFAAIWETRVRLGFGGFELNKPLILWINDGLMTLFFFVVGLEIKREIVCGELREIRKAALPVVAAIGGMIAPATIYLAVMAGRPGHSGWGIPAATDIAFVVGFLALLGPRVPFGLKIMLLTLAIADDIGAILIIALFYSTDISYQALGYAAGGFALLIFLNRIGVRQVMLYVLVGAGIWLAFLKSGVHPTVAGVLIGLLTPAGAWVGKRKLADVVAAAVPGLHADETNEPRNGDLSAHQLGDLAATVRESISPLERLEHGLHPWVAFAIMPLFALANAGVKVHLADFGSPIALAVVAGLFLGKPLGIVLFSWLGTKLGLTTLPAGVNWKILLGAGYLAGIGFTMSIFISDLALNGEMIEDGKLGTLVGSALSAIVGYTLLRLFLPETAA
jgi:NhaA family Na+:H+ antiporter